MLEVAELAVSYGAINAVRGVDLKVEPGQVVALVGSNGAGKSSVLNAISGAVPTVGGRVTFAGSDVTNKDAERIARAGISLVPEGRRIFGTLTVVENLKMGLRRGSGDFEAATEQVITMFPVLKRFWKSPAAVLSGGQQQQLVIARALLTRPDLIMLDEPSLGLDPLVTEVIFESISQLRESGLGVLLVEQNVQRAMELADHIYVMKDGQILHEGRDLGEAWDQLQGAYLGGARKKEEHGDESVAVSG